MQTSFLFSTALTHTQTTSVTKNAEHAACSDQEMAHIPNCSDPTACSCIQANALSLPPSGYLWIKLIGKALLPTKILILYSTRGLPHYRPPIG